MKFPAVLLAGGRFILACYLNSALAREVGPGNLAVETIRLCRKIRKRSWLYSILRTINLEQLEGLCGDRSSRSFCC